MLGAGDPDRARLMSTPFPGGDALRFDIAETGGDGGGKKDGEANGGRDERGARVRTRCPPATARSLGSNSAQTTFWRLDRVQGVCEYIVAIQ